MRDESVRWASVCVCVRERENERKKERKRERDVDSLSGNEAHQEILSSLFLARWAFPSL